MIAIFFALLACSTIVKLGGTTAECHATALGTCDLIYTCCDDTDCYFLIDDERFDCDEGRDCDAAVVEVEDYCGDTGG